jgi:guanylate kinase
MAKGNVFVVTGPSGVGKTTIIKKILSRNKNLEFSVSFTTRSIRENEVEGVDYFFIDDVKFKNIIDSGDFLEYAKVHGNSYGTSKRYVINRIESGVNMLLDIDVQGALNVREKIPEGVSIFISPPSFRDLAQRLTSRGTETKTDISKRL